MEKLELERLSLAELRQLQVAIPRELQKREEAERKAIIEEIREIAKSRGYSLSDLFAAEKQHGRQALPPAYRHPSDSKLTWSGRGRKPAWLVTLIEAGGKLGDFAV